MASSSAGSSKIKRWTRRPSSRHPSPSRAPGSRSAGCGRRTARSLPGRLLTQGAGAARADPFLWPLAAPQPDDSDPLPIASTYDLMTVAYRRRPWLSGNYHPRSPPGCIPRWYRSGSGSAGPARLADGGGAIYPRSCMRRPCHLAAGVAPRRAQHSRRHVMSHGNVLQACQTGSTEDIAM